ncbi:MULTISPECIES: glycine cleavage system protein H [unclassified Gemella]|uniref:glycine cleavage system protein H n=1 Tax=unclassified Gemella TaxID=2624949 RepID=UPI001073FE81|nr:MULTISPECIES: biotin/lipoyl-containing protein [unclassified Gemella]MBF0710038.1 glycine cleavage system protein H [Gemella sp. GL1.1]MBF0746117.1 glycine cleavage system protein H [Gemella sp. 19428wG2_WT2a]NYS27382.1 glycine cleavage system protein H [Gemella sp. GL1]TFU60406.1 glycine cleavage system protein H [Gemella sp. WT2a]
MRKFANYLWVEKKDDVYTIGMTAELQDDVGTIGYVEFTEGDRVEVDDIILNLEASKTIMGILSPLAGKVIERNLNAEARPTLLNSGKKNENWLIKLIDVDQDAFYNLEDE